MIHSSLSTLLPTFLSCVVVATIVHLKASRTVSTVPSKATLVFQEDFDDSKALEHFRRGEPDLGHKVGENGQSAWRIKEGRLHVSKAHNAALWLKTELPEGDVRVLFTARAHSDDGDVKCEFLGDGQHHQSGYILINGGWKNTVRAIARQDEHGEDRHDDHSCKRSPSRRCMNKNQDEEWIIERINGTVYWYIDQHLVLTYRDSHPLMGRQFGFNNWSAPSSFDDLKIYSLRSQ